MFLTERKRAILAGLHSGGQDLAALELRLGVPSNMVRQELRDMRSDQLVRLTITRTSALWELTERGRREVVREHQLSLRGISA